MKTKTFYAVEYSCGLAVCANTGDRYGSSYHAFPNRATRDEWVAGGDFRTSPGYRETVLASDRELRAELRSDYNTVTIHEGSHGNQ